MATPIVLSDRDAARFWRKVRRTDDDSCWEWIAGKFPGGYGNFPLASAGGGVPAHRVAWVIGHGPIPDGLCVLHVCDNPGCVRHLRLGTLEDNNRDRAQKGRSGRRGVRHWSKGSGKGRPQPVPAEQRFWAKVRKTEGCWEWTGALAGGYGRFAIRHGEVMPAHHYSYWLHHGQEVPAGLDLCHACDNRKCVRPDHLFPASRKENLHDAIAKGRFRNPPLVEAGRHPKRKLGPLDVIYIRHALAARERTTSALAASLGVGTQTIVCAATGKTWRSITNPPPLRIQRPPPNGHRRTPMGKWHKVRSEGEVRERFWAKVSKTDSCWLWAGGKAAGHGVFYHPLLQQRIRADRFAYELFRGPVEAGMIPIHTCGRQDCCNPDHMVLGTRGEVNRQAHVGRPVSPNQVRGEQCHHAKLTAEDVVTIRQLYDSGQASLAELTKRYALAKTNMFKVIHRITWKHIP